MPRMDQLRPHMTGLAPVRDVSGSQAASGGRRVEHLLTSTWALRLILPLLVAGSGLAILAIGDAALRRGMDRLAQARFADQSAVLGEHVHIALDRSQSRLDSLAELVRTLGTDLPREHLAREIQLSLERNPAISWLSLSTPDGHYRGAYRDDDGQLIFNECRLGTGGQPGIDERFTIAADGKLGTGTTKPTSYDPRVRPFYLLAAQATGKVWTDPYLFWDGITGTTCAMALRDAAGQVIAVLSLDFDSTSLGKALGQLPTIPGSRSFVVSADGTVLGFTGPPLPSRSGGRVVKLLDLDDPHLLTLVQAMLTGQGDGSLKTDEGIRIAARPLTPWTGQTWQMVSYAPEAEIIAAAGALRQRAAIVALAAIALAALVGWLVAGALGRVRRERGEAREEARRALAAANELGSYRLVKRLGVGGMGEVWRGEHRQLARPAAIKLMRTMADQDVAVLRERFSREAQVIAGLHCRNTVGLYDYGVSDDGSLYYVMELLDGLDLDQLVEAHGPVPPQRAVAILRQACLSLAEAHDQGLVHRDIKPANIYLCRLADEVDVVKVLDFGLVLAVQNGRDKGSSGRLSMPGTVFGTPTCMAPEQARGLEIDGRADLYAIGCVAWWLVTGKTPFDAADAMGQLLAHVNSPLPDLRALRPELPETLVVLINDLLAKDPAARPADAREVIRRLRLLGPIGGDPWDEEIAAVWWMRHRPQADSKPSRPAAASDVGLGDVATAPTLPLPTLD